MSLSNRCSIYRAEFEKSKDALISACTQTLKRRTLIACQENGRRVRPWSNAHFKREKFSVLIGAARVLGEEFEMSIGETLEKGSYQFAKEKISLHPEKDKTQDT